MVYGTSTLGTSNEKLFAWVPSNHIKHAGKIIGHDGCMRLLSGAGLKGYNHYALWVPVTQLKPLEEVTHLGRTVDSLTLREQRKRQKRKKHVE